MKNLLQGHHLIPKMVHQMVVIKVQNILLAHLELQMVHPLNNIDHHLQIPDVQQHNIIHMIIIIIMVTMDHRIIIMFHHDVLKQPIMGMQQM